MSMSTESDVIEFLIEETDTAINYLKRSSDELEDHLAKAEERAAFTEPEIGCLSHLVGVIAKTLRKQHNLIVMLDNRLHANKQS